MFSGAAQCVAGSEALCRALHDVIGRCHSEALQTYADSSRREPLLAWLEATELIERGMMDALQMRHYGGKNVSAAALRHKLDSEGVSIEEVFFTKVCMITSVQYLVRKLSYFAARYRLLTFLRDCFVYRIS